jgi:hypothetical protein
MSSQPKWIPIFWNEEKESSDKLWPNYTKNHDIYYWKHSGINSQKQWEEMIKSHFVYKELEQLYECYCHNLVLPNEEIKIDNQNDKPTLIDRFVTQNIEYMEKTFAILSKQQTQQPKYNALEFYIFLLWPRAIRKFCINSKSLQQGQLEAAKNMCKHTLPYEHMLQIQRLLKNNKQPMTDISRISCNWHYELFNRSDKLPEITYNEWDSISLKTNERGIFAICSSLIHCIFNWPLHNGKNNIYNNISNICGKNGDTKGLSKLLPQIPLTKQELNKHKNQPICEQLIQKIETAVKYLFIYLFLNI